MLLCVKYVSPGVPTNTTSDEDGRIDTHQKFLFLFLARACNNNCWKLNSVAMQNNKRFLIFF